MKHVYILIIALFTVAVSAQAQVTIYSEDFNRQAAGTTLPFGYTSASGDWSVANTGGSAGASGMSGGNYLRAVRNNNGNAIPDAHIVELKGIRVKGFTTVKIRWADIKTKNHQQSVTSDVALQYSIDNSTQRHSVNIGAQGAVNGGWKIVNNGQFITISNIPATATSINFYWTISMSRSQDFYGIDDIAITGDLSSENDVFSWGAKPLLESPFTVSGPAAQMPYTLDYVPMRWTRTVAKNTTLVADHVRNDYFQAPNKCLALGQSGANATQGTTINIAFDDNMADLTFTLLHVDQRVGQYQDQVIITAVNSAGKQVLLQDEHVLRGAKVKFTAATGAVTGVSGQNIEAGSNEGDVVVRFAEPVQQVTLAYYNLDGVRNTQGAQGIAIHNISGRAAGIITPLPVTLVSFKGTMQQGAARLNWSTASELDNDKFLVERSQDGKTFKAIGEVKGRGTSSMMQHYTFTDNAPVSGTNYYRLKQVDYDGTFEYSKTFALQATLAASSVVFPTLATEEITVKLATIEGQVEVLISDMTGKQLTAVRNPSERQLVMPVQHLKTGVYFVTVVSSTQKETIRFVKK